MMNVDQVLLLVDEIMTTNTGNSLNGLQYAILKSAWQGKTYAIIAEEYNCTEGHAKDVGYLLWQRLSDILGKKVTKNNFRYIIQQSNFSPPLSYLVPEESFQFLGRQNSLTDLQNLVAQNCKIIVIQGEGGIGKTTLARKFFNLGQFDQRSQQRESAVLGGAYEFCRKTTESAPWLSPRSTFRKKAPSLYGGVICDLILEVLMAKETQNIISAKSLVEEWFYKDLKEESGQEFGVTLARLKRHLQTKKVGILIDNLEPALDKDGKLITPHRDYVELLRILGDETVQSITLITSRDRLCEGDINLQHYRLSGLSLTAWEQYFNLRQILFDAVTLAKIHHIYGGNAKAMGIISGITIEDFQNNLQSYWQENYYDPLAKTDLKNLIASQFDRLKKLDYSAYILLCRLGCYRYQDIPQISRSGLLCLVLDLPSHRSINIVESLKNRSLIEFSQGKYWLHPAIQAEARLRLKSESLTINNNSLNPTISWQQVNHNIAKFYTQAVKQINTIEDGLMALEAYYHYLDINDFEAAAKVILYTRDNQWGQYLTLGSSLFRLGLVQPLFTVINQVIEHIKNLKYRSELNNILGDLYWTMGEILQGIICQQSTITAVTQALENSLLDQHENYYFKMLQVDSLLSMGLYKIDLWELSEASKLLQKVIDLAQDTKHHPWAEKAVLCLALVESYQGKTIKSTEVANKFYQLIICEKNPQYNTGRFVYFMQILGQILLNLNDNYKAQEIFINAIAFSQESYYTQIKAKSLIGLAVVHRNQNQFTTACSLHQEAIDLLAKIGAKCDLAKAYYQWGLTLALLKELKLSQQAYNQAIQLFQQIQAPLQVTRVQQSLIY